MATYLIVNLLFLAAVWLLLRPKWYGRPQLLTLLALLVLTLVFDSLIVGLGLVGYDDAKILGWRLGAAPIEDFFYALLAALAIPHLWRLSDRWRHV